MNYKLKLELTLISVGLLTGLVATVGSMSTIGQDMIVNHSTAWRTYFWSTTIFVFVIFTKYPGKKPNLIGDLMVSFLLGWMWWPFAIWYAIRAHNRSRKEAA